MGRVKTDGVWRFRRSDRRWWSCRPKAEACIKIYHPTEASTAMYWRVLWRRWDRRLDMVVWDGSASGTFGGLKLHEAQAAVDAIVQMR